MKEIIIAPKLMSKEIFEHALAKGINSFYCNPSKIPKDLRTAVKVYFKSKDADVEVVSNFKDAGEKAALEIFVKTPQDMERAVAAAKSGVKTLIIRAEDWKVISLENLIADLKPFNVKLIATASELAEVETLLGALEHGADGVLVEISDVDEINLVHDLVNAPRKLDLVEAEVIEAKEVGLGERACIDTTSILDMGEGMLVGNTSSMFALIHNECMGSAFTSPRPFRVNAGAIHSYILMPDNSTKYLSELRAGDRALIVSRKGARVAAIGRIKIERRPLKLIKLRSGDIEGSVTLQDAETISLVSPDGEPVSITAIKPGDKVLAHIPESKARHFGRAVDEFIIEK